MTRNISLEKTTKSINELNNLVSNLSIYVEDIRKGNKELTKENVEHIVKTRKKILQKVKEEEKFLLELSQKQ